MQREKVTDSATISGIGYDGSNMLVEFKDGSTYQYNDVPMGIFHGMQSASSKGAFLSRHIKGKFTHKKV